MRELRTQREHTCGNDALAHTQLRTIRHSEHKATLDLFSLFLRTCYRLLTWHSSCLYARHDDQQANHEGRHHEQKATSIQQGARVRRAS